MQTPTTTPRPSFLGDKFFPEGLTQEQRRLMVRAFLSGKQREGVQYVEGGIDEDDLIDLSDEAMVREHGTWS